MTALHPEDLLWDFGAGEMSYPAFAARVRRCLAGRNEDNDDDEPDDEDLEPQPGLAPYGWR